MKINKLLLAMICTGLSVSSLANESSVNIQVVTEAELGTQSVENVAVAVIDPADQVDEKVSTYIQSVEDRVNRAGKSHLIQFFKGTAHITVDKNNPEWSNYRSLALEEAVLNARESYLKTVNNDFVQDQVKDFFKAKGLPEPTASEFQNEGMLDQMINKAIAVVDGKLSQELKDMGINPSEFKAANPQKKQTLFKQYIGTKSMTTAYGDLSGMFVTQTFEVLDENGKGSVAVVMALSANKRDKVKALIESKGQIEPDPNRANPDNANIVAKLVSNKALFLEVGTDLWYDDKGYPMLISYGQSGVNYTTDPDEREIEREAAFGFAEDNAWGSLAATYNLSGDFSKESSKGQSKIKEKIFELASGSVRKSETDIQKKISSVIESSTAMTASIKDMTGVKVEHTWRQKHPITGKEMAGVVIVWHPVRIQTAEAMQSGKTAQQIDAAKPRNKKVATSSHSFESIDKFDVVDF